MDAVAIVAGRRDDQAHLDEGPAMDAVEVLRGGFGMFDAVFGGEVGIVMTPGAGLREVHLEHRGSRVYDGQDVMRTVAIPAISRAGRAQGVAHAVDAGGVLFGLF